MARPKEGYHNAAGQPIPGTGDINGRFKNSSRLLYWAFNRGKSGAANLRDEAALDTGSCVHMLAELDLKNTPEADIEFYLNTTLRDPDERTKAAAAFGAFRKWKSEFHVAPRAHEVSLISETLQYGGTLDFLANVRGKLALIDFKTTKSGEVYEDMALQLAAYGILWDENHPTQKLDGGYHLILLPKDGSKPIHREFTHEALQPYRSKFWLYRKAYDLDAVCNDPKLLQGIAVAPSIAPEQKPKRAARRATARPVDTCTGSRIGSMAEMLRAYGHLRSGATA
jgi:hypothetical protein